MRYNIKSVFSYNWCFKMWV